MCRGEVPKARSRSVGRGRSRPSAEWLESCSERGRLLSSRRQAGSSTYCMCSSSGAGRGGIREWHKAIEKGGAREAAGQEWQRPVEKGNEMCSACRRRGGKELLTGSAAGPHMITDGPSGVQRDYKQHWLNNNDGMVVKTQQQEHLPVRGRLSTREAWVEGWGGGDARQGPGEFGEVRKRAGLVKTLVMEWPRPGLLPTVVSASATPTPTPWC